MSSRPCYHVRGENGERVLIPNCIGTLLSNDMRLCVCDRTKPRESLEERVQKLEQAVRTLTAPPPPGAQP